MTTRRRVKPYSYGLPPIRQANYPQGQGQQSISQTSGQRDEQQQQQMPQIPRGLFDELMKARPDPYSNLGEAATSAGEDVYGPSEALSTSYGNELGDYLKLGDGLFNEGAISDIGSSALDIGGEAAIGEGLLGPAAEIGAEGLATGATEAAAQAAAEEAAATSAAEAGASTAAEAGSTAAAEGAATTAGSSVPIAGWAILAASLMKKALAGSDPGTPEGALNTLLMPSPTEWMTDPGRSFSNVMDPPGMALGDLTGVGDEKWFNFLSPSGWFS